MDINKIDSLIRDSQIQLATLEARKQNIQANLSTIQDEGLLNLYNEVNNPNTTLERLLEIEVQLSNQLQTAQQEVQTYMNEVSKYVN